MIEIALDIMGTLILMIIGTRIGIGIGKKQEFSRFCKVMIAFFKLYEQELKKEDKKEFACGVLFVNSFIIDNYVGKANEIDQTCETRELR